MKKTFSLLVIFSLILFGCEKEGPMGPTGPAGNDGADGKDGKDGNANVKSYTFIVKQYDWFSHGTFGTFPYYYDVTLSVSAITNDIIEKGAVLVYMKDPDENIYMALPFTWLSEFYIETALYYIEVGSIIIEIKDSDNMILRPETDLKFKVVIIEGISLKSLSSIVDLTNYQGVKERFGL